jgi:ribosome modulation factor
MTHTQIYRQGVKAFLDGKPLSVNPYDPAVNSEAYEAWRDGWRDANHSRWRRLEMAACTYANPSRQAGVGSP